MKIAVITGASSGLGREFAKQINQHFVTLDEVWLIARREERLNELKESLHGVHVRTIPIDLCDRDAVGTYEEMLQKFHPQIRVLVNAAGYGKMGYVEQISEEDLAGEIRLNCESLTRRRFPFHTWRSVRISSILQAPLHLCRSQTSRSMQQANPMCFHSPEPCIRN